MTTQNGNGRRHSETMLSPDSAGGRRRARRIRKRITTVALAAAILLAGGLWWHFHQGNDKGPLANLQTAKAFRTTLLETVSAQGSVTAQTGAEVKIGSQITGRIKRLFADVGSHVNAGQLIAELDLPDIEAQLGQAEANLSLAETKLQQQESGVGMQRTQTSDAITTALQALRDAQAKEVSAAAAANLQPRQTRSDILRAQAALNTAQATLQQAEKGHDLQIATAQAAINQAKANADNDAANLRREMQLYKESFIAASDVDTARAAAQVAAAQLDSARQNLILVQQKADTDVQTAKEQVAQAQASLTAAQAETYQNSERQAELESAQAAVQQARSQLNSAQAGLAQDTLKNQDVLQAQEAVRQAMEQVKYQQAQMDKTLIRSPISGTVLQLASQQGETLAAGLSAPTLIIVADLSRLQVDAFVDETDIGKVRLGQSATITVDAYPNQKFVGRVSKIASGSTLQQGVVTYDVSIAIHDPQRLLKPDMTASVILAVGEHPDVVVVPNEAVKPDPSGSIVWLLPPKVKGVQPDPQMQPVKTGATDGTYTEIQSGLNDGDTVVLAGWPPPEQPGRMEMTPFGMRPSRGGGHGRGRGG